MDKKVYQANMKKNEGVVWHYADEVQEFEGRFELLGWQCDEEFRVTTFKLYCCDDTCGKKVHPVYDPIGQTFNCPDCHALLCQYTTHCEESETQEEVAV